MRELVKRRAADGDDKAQELLGDPDISGEALTYYRIFIRLAGSRQVGMGVGPIPISEVKAYCEFMGLDSEFERERLLYMVGVADGVYLEQVNKRMERKESKPPSARRRR